MKTLILLAAILVGCGTTDELQPSYQNKIVSLDVFEPYVEMFVAQAADHGQQINVDALIVRFKDIPQKDDNTTILGRCFSGGTSTPTIDIDPDTWDNMNLIRRHLLMFHELGHCLLLREHIDPTVKRSIMNPFILDSKYFADYEGYFLNELFDPSTFNSLHSLRLTGEMEFDCD